MKVLHVIDTLNIGGAERVFLDITSLLAEANIKVGALLYYNQGPWIEQLDKRVELNILNRKNKYSLKELYKTYKVCSRYDIIHAHMSYCYTYITLSRLLFGGKYKVIFHDHNGDHDAFGSEIGLGLKYMFRPHYYIGVSKKLEQWAVSDLKVPEKYAYTLINIIKPNSQIKYQPKPGLKKAFIVSNFRSTKNLEFGIELFDNLDWSLTMFGNCIEPTYYKEILQLAAKHPNITIREGVSDFTNVYNDFGLAIHCAKSESGPLVLLEYLAYGIPFVAYQTGEIADIVQRDLPECFLKTFNTNAWIQKITTIQNDEELPAKLKEVFSRHFSSKAYLKECLKIYEEIN